MFTCDTQRAVCHEESKPKTIPLNVSDYHPENLRGTSCSHTRSALQIELVHVRSPCKVKLRLKCPGLATFASSCRQQAQSSELRGQNRDGFPARSHGFNDRSVR